MKQRNEGDDNRCRRWYSVDSVRDDFRRGQKRRRPHFGGHKRNTREEKKNGLKCRDGDDDGMPSTTAAHRNEIIIRHDRSRDKDKRLFRH